MRRKGTRKRDAKKGEGPREYRRRVMERLSAVEERVVALLNSSTTYLTFFDNRAHDLRANLTTELRLGNLSAAGKIRIEEQISAFSRGRSRMEQARTQLSQYLGTVRLLKDTMLPEGLNALVASIDQLKQNVHGFASAYSGEDFQDASGATPWTEMEIEVGHLSQELDGLEVILRDAMRVFQA